MSRTVDQRVVEMKFDNKQFESAVNQSRQSIQLMERDLKLLENAKHLENLDRSVSRIDFSHMSNSLDKLKNSFSIMGTVGRSVINKLTTDAMNKFTESCNKAKASVEKVFDTIYQKGYNRASNLESSKFQLEGTLKRSYDDISKVADVSGKLQKIINDSVTDTAFGLDQASVAASTLASTYGTSEKGLEKINTSLRSIAGIAGSTGADYQIIADIFTDAAGKGVAMGDEFGRLSLYGLNAEKEVAKYANRHVDIQKKLNKELKKSGKITQDDIKSLSSKRKITAELFAATFDDKEKSFFKQAQEANETLTGVLANIGAAEGRLGALFIQPLIQNSGSLVKFLQQVKRGISDIAKIFTALKIPDNIMTFFNQVIDVGKKKLDKFLSDFEKGITPLNEFFDQVGKAVDNLTLMLSLFDDNLKDANRGEKALYKDYFVEAVEADKYLEDSLAKQGKTYKSLSKITKELGKNNTLKNFGKLSKGEKEYLKQINDGNPKTLKEWQALYKTKIKTDFRKSLDWTDQGSTKKNQKQLKENQKLMKEFEKSSAFENSYKSAGFEKYHEQLTKLAEDEGRLEKIDSSVRQRIEETGIFGYDYLSDIWSGIKNIVGGIASVFKEISDAVFGADGPLSDFFSIFTGGDEDVTESRKALNKFSKEFKESTEKFKEFMESEGAKKVVSVLKTVFNAIGKIVGGIATIIGAIAKAVGPILGKIFGALSNILGLSDEGEEKASTFDTIIRGICKVIEWLGQVLENAWDLGVKFVQWLKENGVIDFLGKVKDKIVDFAKYVYENWPEIWGKIKDKLKDFGNIVKKIAGWIYDKLQPAIDFIQPYIENLTTKISDLTNGFLDLKKPVKWIKGLFGDTADDANTVSDAISNVAGSVSDLNNSGKNGIGLGVSDSGPFLGRMPNMLNALDPSLFNFAEEQEKEENFWSHLMDKSKENENKKGIFQGFFKGLAGEKDSSFLEHLKGYFSWVSDVVFWAKQKLYDAMTDKDVKDVFEWIFKIFQVVAAVFVGSKVTSIISDAFDGFNNVMIAVNGVDAKTLSKEATAKVLKAIALLIGTFAVGVLLISYSIYTLGRMHWTDLLQGMIAFAIIASIIIALVGGVMALSKFLAGETSTGEGFKQMNIGGLKLPSFGYTGGAQNIKESGFKVLIGVAALIGVFALGVMTITGAISILGHMDPNVLAQGMAKFVTISIFMMGIVALVLLFAYLMFNPTSSSNSSLVNRIAGSNKKPKGKVDKSSLGGLGNGIGMTLFGVAAIIYVFAAAVTKIAVALQLLSLIPAGDMDRSFAIFAGVAGLMLLLVGMVLVFAYAMLHDANNKKADKLAKNLIFIMGGTAIILLVFAMSVKKIMKAIANLAIVGSFTDLEKAADIFETVSTVLILITALALGSAFVITKFNQSPAAYKNVSKVLGLSAVVIAAFGLSSKMIMKGIASLAKNMAGMSEQQMDSLNDIVNSTLIILGLIMAAVMAFAIVMQKSGITKAQAQKIQGLLGLIAVIIGVIALAMLAIGHAAEKLKDINNSKSWGLVAALGIVVLIILAVAVVIAVGKKCTNALSVLIGLAAVLGVVAALIVAVGYAASLMKDVDEDTLKWLAVSLGILAVIIVAVMAFAYVAGKLDGIKAGIKAVAAIMIALGALFALIGVAAYLIGKGADLFVSAIERFMSALERFATIKDKKIKKGAKKVGSAVREFLNGLIDAIIKFGDDVGGKKEALKGAITKILNIIQESITTFWVTLEANILDRLGQLIDKLGPWLSTYGPKLTKILQQLENIFWFGLIQPFFYDLGQFILQQASAAIDWINKHKGDLIQDFIDFGCDLLVKLGEGITNNTDKIVSALTIAIHSLINLLCAFIGIDPPFDDVTEKIEQFNDSEKPEELGKSMDNKIKDGIEKGADGVATAAKQLIGKIGDALWEALITNETFQDVTNYISEMANSWLHPWESQEFLILSGAAQKGIAKEVAEYEANLIKHGMPKKEAQKRGAAWGAALARQMVKGFDKHAEINSPSKVMEERGKYVDQGLANGINKNSGLVVSAAYKQADHINSAYDAALFNANNKTEKKAITTAQIFSNLGDNFKKSLPKLTKVIEDSGLFDTDKFIIKPGMDLSNITKDSKQLQKLFDSVGLSNVNAGETIGLFDNLKKGNFNKIDVSSLANGFDSANDKNGSKSSSDPLASLGSINFTQNNYSPKSLSQIDIYRQTENLLGKQSTLNSLASSVGLTGTNF